jgi:8-oxo-dGTP pyrophosphatase MutT (NUDIX family)
VILQPDDLPQDSQDEKHVLLTIQPRIPAASLAFPELPAGMVDDGGNFAGAAAREIKEELGNPRPLPRPPAKSPPIHKLTPFVSAQASQSPPPNSQISPS